jgi:hypothetical protein
VIDERHRKGTLLELLVDNAEDYQRSNECDSQLFRVIRPKGCASAFTMVLSGGIAAPHCLFSVPSLDSPQNPLLVSRFLLS